MKLRRREQLLGRLYESAFWPRRLQVSATLLTQLSESELWLKRLRRSAAMLPRRLSDSPVMLLQPLHDQPS